MNCPNCEYEMKVKEEMKRDAIGGYRNKKFLYCNECRLSKEIPKPQEKEE